MREKEKAGRCKFTSFAMQNYHRSVSYLAIGTNQDILYFLSEVEMV